MESLKIRSFLLRFGMAAAVAALFYCGIRFALPCFLPLLLGGLLAALLHPVAAGLCSRLGCGYRPCAIVTAALTFLTLAVLLWVLGGLLVSQGSALLQKLPDFYSTSLQPLLRRAEALWQSVGEFLRPDRAAIPADWGTSAADALLSAVRSASSAMLQVAGNFVSALPTVVITLSFTVVTTFLFLTDYRRITSFFVRVLPAATLRPLVESKRFLLGTARRIVGAYLLIMLITFGEIALGLWLLRVPYFAVIGFVIALLDILPFIGSGMALIPWGLIRLFLHHNTALGVGLLILYAVVAAVRFFIEPRIVGGRIGLHPLATLTAMYAGLRLCGFWGFLLAPLFTTLAVHLYRCGFLPRRRC